VGDALGSPGKLIARTGAVESDITAISLSLGTYSKVQVAISVIGPEHRLDHKAVKVVGVQLEQAVDALKRTLGVDVKAVAS